MFEDKLLAAAQFPANFLFSLKVLFVWFVCLFVSFCFSSPWIFDTTPLSRYNIAHGLMIGSR